MNPTATPAWPHNLHEDGLLPPDSSAEDFTSYLDLDLDFSTFDGIQTDDGSMDAGIEGYMDQQNMMGHGHQPDYERQHMPQPAMQQQRHQHQHQQMPQMYQPANLYQRPRRLIPPTPTSNELQGGAATYYQPTSGHMGYDYPSKDEQMSFTPLVSPAVTPADAVFHLPEYAIPGEYLSPLTSPAIEAQNAHHRTFHGQFVPETSSCTSPADRNADATHVSAPPTPAATKQRRKQSISKTASRSVRQSPIVKPQSKRKSQRNLNPAAVAELAEAEQNEESKTVRPSGGETAIGSESSGQDSVSPEALAEALMPPPALPHSRSPAVRGKSKSPFMTGKEPATPATLMRLQKDRLSQSPLGGRPSASSEPNPDVMEDIMLPEPATSVKPMVAPIDPNASSLDDQSTPVLSARDPKSRPGSSSAGPSASSTPIALTPRSKEPISPDEDDTTRPKAGARAPKKRQSVSAPHISPAIMPKISPHIKPLIPSGAAGAITADHSALYLASKSNYQNILDGTHLPGVTYPDTLAENLSSKRTSHKIAEQGRRNRINTALKEIEALLPPTPPIRGEKGKDLAGSPEDDVPTEKEKPAGPPTTSKANTVEMAIVYIKQLQAELKEVTSKLAQAEKKLAEVSSSNEEASD